MKNKNKNFKRSQLKLKDIPGELRKVSFDDISHIAKKSAETILKALKNKL